MRPLYYLFCALLWAGYPLFAQPTFHAILLGATNDPGIGVACQIDLLATNARLASIAGQIGYVYAPVLLKDQAFGFNGFVASLGGLRCGAEDIVVFYYTGHGFNISKNDSDFPLLLLDTTDAGKILPLDFIHQLLLKKKPRFCLTIGDCCNRLIDEKLPVDRSVAKGTVCNADIFRQLFLNQRGGVLVASSKRGQVSGASVNGSHFTWSLLQSLDYACYYNQQASWKQVLDDTQNRMQNITLARVAGQQSIYAITGPDSRPVGSDPVMVRSDTLPAMVATAEPPASGTVVAGAGPPSAPPPIQVVRPVADDNAVRPGAGEPTTPAVSISLSSPTAQPQAPPVRPDYSRVNQYLNALADGSTSYAARKELANRAGDFFIHNARVRVFVKDTQVELLPLSEVMERYGLLAGKIRQINVIETLSKLDPSGRYYTELAVQELWK